MKQLWNKLIQLITGGGAAGVYYIGGCDVLPPPLKGEQEQEVLESLEQGSEEAKQLLIERNLRLVAHIMNKG